MTPPLDRQPSQLDALVEQVRDLHDQLIRAFDDPDVDEADALIAAESFAGLIKATRTQAADIRARALHRLVSRRRYTYDQIGAILGVTKGLISHRYKAAAKTARRGPGQPQLPEVNSDGDSKAA